MAGTAKAVMLPFKEAVEYLQQKDPRISSHWTEYLNEAHARSFVVAGAAKQALVEDFKAAIDKAISQGTGFDEFRGDFADIVKKHGWNYRGAPGWREKIIYRTNMSTAYAAGRYVQQTDPDVLAAFPYWEYLHVNCPNPRLQHLAWSGMVLRADDPWWSTNYPPNGWGCHCIVGVVNDRGLAARGKTKPDKAPDLDWREYINKTTGVITRAPAGVDPGFAYNPGKAWKEGAKQPLRAPDVRPADKPLPLPKTAQLGTPEKANEVLKAAMQPWANKLSAAEAGALEDYKGVFGRDINEALRNEAKADKDLLLTAKILEAALDRAKMPIAVRAYRAISADEARIYAGLKLGQHMETEQFVSTSVVEDVAKKLAAKNDQVVVRIIVPEGTRGAAYIHPFPRYRFPQYELLLNVGMKLRILRNDGDQVVLLAGNGNLEDGK